MPSLRDVARELDVSVSLVSKVLNDRLGTTGVRPALVETIRETAERMGYRKNFSALSLLARRQNAIAVFVHVHGAQGSGLVEKLLDGISRATGPGSQRISLEIFLDASEFREKRKNLHRGQVDGLILTGVKHPELREDLLELQRTELPVVTVYNEPIDRRIVNIGIPHAALSHAATSHLLRQGCRRILHPAVIDERTAGHRKALRDAGIRCPKELLSSFAQPDGFRAPAGETSVRDALAKGIAFDGVSAQSDAQALGALNVLIRQGVRVPEDVKVIGIDNAPFAEFAIVPLSSIGQRFVDRGRLAVETLNRMVAGEKCRSVSLEPDLRIRESTR